MNARMVDSPAAGGCVSRAVSDGGCRRRLHLPGATSASTAILLDMQPARVSTGLTALPDLLTAVPGVPRSSSSPRPPVTARPRRSRRLRWAPAIRWSPSPADRPITPANFGTKLVETARPASARRARVRCRRPATDRSAGPSLARALKQPLPAQDGCTDPVGLRHRRDRRVDRRHPCAQPVAARDTGVVPRADPGNAASPRDVHDAFRGAARGARWPAVRCGDRLYAHSPRPDHRRAG